ncbi:hypothetical protein OEA41_004491 [Lepraria neglecta]|uniref:Major facilitator superfamily (MFS) profile domain-containing protein n=1 Tax=Lepraria neglecta TaxID=209136 RepID=A0AAD9YYP6_9LECA|nr:hypothetical protein OEA41_004491 [Lepraria neglecta]
MDDSSGTEATMDHEKTSTEVREHSSAHQSMPKDNMKTEANIMPDTSEETHDLDIEKAAQDEKPKPPGGFDPSSFPDGGWEAWLAVSGAFCVCSPIGASLIFYPAMSSTGTWFFKKRAFAFGVMAAGSSLGGVIFPIMIERLIAERGFPWAMRAAAFLILGLLIYANFTVKSRLPPTPRPWALMDFIKPFMELPYFLTVFGAFLFFFGMFLPFTFIILSAQYNGMSANLSGYLLAILNAASIFGRTLPGWIADKVGRFNTMAVTSFLSTILVLALWLPAKGNVPYILFAALFGFSSGAFVSLAPALIVQISDVRQIGVRTGSMFAAISVAALCGNPIGGALVSHEDGNYLHLQIFCGVVMFAGSCVFVAARYCLEGLDLRKKV